MLEENIHSHIIRLFSGEASPDEKNLVRDWLSQSEKNRKMYADLQEIWLATGNSNEYNTEQAITHFKARIKQRRVTKIRFSEIIKYAAIAILLISMPFVYRLGKQVEEPVESYTTITCAFGDKSNVTLPDGSEVQLNSGSKITFNNNFQQKYRRVTLEGEAYFGVKKNPQVPFRVKASEIEVEVLGTEFNLKAYPDETYISTTLVEGSVRIKTKNEKTVLEPSQKAVFDRHENEIELYDLTDVLPETEWKDGRLVFRNESLGELELKLERWFDVDIDFADGRIKNRRFTGILERESILEALTYFSYSEQVGYKINDNEITFYSK